MVLSHGLVLSNVTVGILQK